MAVVVGMALHSLVAGAEETEQENDADYEYETVVPGYRLRPTDEVTGFAETIDVEEEVKTFGSVSEVISDSVGVQVRSTGGLGSYSNVSIRGSTSAQVPVFLDGVQLNAGGFSSVNLGDLSLDSLESIEIYRGSAPLSLGGGIGGAVSLKTRSFEEPTTEAAMSYGSWNTMRLFMLRGDKVGEVSGLALFSASGSEGDFKYLDTNGTVVANEDDDTIEKRKNNQHTAYSGLVKLNGEIGSWNWIVLNDLFAKQQGVAFIESLSSLRTDLHASLRDLRGVLAARLGGPLCKFANLFVDVNYMAVSEDFSDTEGELFGLPVRTQSSTDAVGGSALLEVEFSKRHESAIRAASRYERYTEDLVGQDDDQSPSTRTRVELGLGHKWTIWRSLAVLPALRGEIHLSKFGGGLVPGTPFEFEPYSLFDYYITPALGIRFEIIEGLILRANGGRYLRTPDLSELFGYSGTMVGNPELSAEVGYNADVGATFILERLGPVDLLRLDGAWFATWSEDLITYVQNSQDTVRPENIDSATIQGFEAALGVSLIHLVSLQGNYTYIHGVNTSDIPFYNGKYIPGRPRHEAYAKVEVQNSFERWGAGAWFDVEYMGKGYLTPSNDKENTFERRLLDLGGRVEYIKAGLTLTVEVENLLDTITMKNEDGDLRPLRDFRNSPLPGRTVLATIHWRI
jgi:outer membrane cobalamin receptor